MGIPFRWRRRETRGTPVSARLGQFQVLGSLRLAVILIVALAAVLACATVLEAARGREYAQWYVYKSDGFIALLALLGLNILAATAMRFPWKQRIAFLVTHLGLLLLLGGSIQTFLGGTDGRLTIVEGEASNSILIPTQTEFAAVWPESDQSRAAAFIFRPGPVDWPQGKTLDLGQLNGVHLRVLRFLRHARVKRTWVRDPARTGDPAIEFALHGSDGKQIRQQWLVASPFRGASKIGPAEFEFHQAPANTMADDFLNPPSVDSEKLGVLAIHYDGHTKRVAVEQQMGKQIPLEGGQVSVEIQAYLPNAQPDGNGGFRTVGEEPVNPMLEILVHLPGEDAPQQQIAFALHPLLNFDSIHGGSCPVKFWYHHAAVSAESKTEFLQTPDGKLFCRTGIDGRYESRGQVRLNQRMPIAAGFQVSLLKHLPSAREQVTFEGVQLAAGATQAPEAAALVEIQAGGITENQWLKRQDPSFGERTISTPKGPLSLQLGYERLPLPFSLELLNFERRKNPGRMGDAAFKSTVRLVDRQQDLDTRREISMNEPLTHGKFTLYQSGFDELPSGKQASILTAAYDPGRSLKYLGCLMICLGSFAMFYARAVRWFKIPWPFGRRSSAGKGDGQPSSRKQPGVSGPKSRTAHRPPEAARSRVA